MDTNRNFMGKYNIGFENAVDLSLPLSIYITNEKLYDVKYVWPRSYVADGGDVFSFGSNTFSSTEPYTLSIKVHGNKKCFSSARQEIRNVQDANNIKNEFSELSIIEKDDENIVTTLLPASEKDRAVYISLAQ